MTPWNEGYVSDISYAGGVYREQTPSHLDAACLVAGVAPPVAPGEPFSYCELGCGLGDTAMVIAAACPQARVWGFDFNPAHIAHACACAARAGLDNLVLAERSFEELAEAPPADMPPFDYVTMHGVWSWVSPANRAHLVTFLRKHLKPGGLLSLSYNAMPGWTGAIALQHLLMETGRSVGGSSDVRIREAVALARRISDIGGSALDAKQVERLEALLAKGQVSYLSHEYLNDHWSPVFCSEVAAALLPAKVSYVGSANMLENFPGLCVKPEARALVDGLPADLRQSVQDYFCPRSFRRDVFIRGVRAMPARERRLRLGSQRLALAVPAKVTTCRIGIPLGEATLNEAFYAPALASLGHGNASIDDLLAAAAPGTAPVPEEVIGMLIGSRQVLPVRAAADPACRPEALARVRRFNRAGIATAIDAGQDHCWLAGVVAGSAILVGLLEMLVYEVVTAEEDRPSLPSTAIRSGVLALMAERGMSMRHDASDASSTTDAAVETFVEENLPIWRRIGAL